MQAWTLAAKRSLSQAALLSSIAIVVSVVTGFLVGGASYLDVASDRVPRSDLAGVPARITRTLESPALTATRDGTPLGDASSTTVLIELAADAGLQQDAAARWREAAGVADQVAQHLHQNRTHPLPWSTRPSRQIPRGFSGCTLATRSWLVRHRIQLLCV